jgi:endonuclease/exonuclease/phosphatase family metal-dependent hydrolase
MNGGSTADPRSTASARTSDRWAPTCRPSRRASRCSRSIGSCNPQSLISDIEVHDTALSRVASDHLPIKARINVAGAASNFQSVRGCVAA